MPQTVRVRHHQVMNSPTADRVVDALIAARLVDPDVRRDSIGVVAGVLGSPGRSSESSSQAVAAQDARTLPQLVEVVAYLGGALVLSAGGLFLFEQWDGLGFGAQVVLLAVVAVVLGVAGGVASRVAASGAALRTEQHKSRRRLAGTLLIGAALVVAFLVGRVVEEMMDSEFSEVYWPAALGAGAGVLVAGIGYRIAPTAVGVVGLMGGVVTVVMNLVAGIDRYEGDVVGGALFLVGVVWLGLSEARWFCEVTLARVLGVGTTLVGAQVPIIEGAHPWHGYLLTVLVAVVGIGIYLDNVSWPYLAAAVLAVTLVVPEAVSDWTDGSLGPIGGVLVTGVALLLASFAGYRLRAEAID
jgi:hypothetical protein